MSEFNANYDIKLVVQSQSSTTSDLILSTHVLPADIQIVRPTDNL